MGLRQVSNTSTAGAAPTKKVEVDVGVDFVDDATFVIADASVKPTSLVTAQVLGLTPSDGRDVDEIYAERVSVFARPMAGSVQFDLLPFEGNFSGKFVVGYQVA